MRLSMYVATMGCAAAATFGAMNACGQAYPTKVVRIVTSEAGAGADFAARLIAQGLTASFGHRKSYAFSVHPTSRISSRLPA